MNDIKVVENKFLREKYYYIKHKSGLPIYVFPKDLTSTYAIIGTDYGSIDNRFKLAGDKDFIDVPAGIAHFLEHKMFANEDGTDSFEKFSEFGASANAYTSSNMTAYLFSCTEQFEKSFEELLTFVTHPYFSKESVEKEQGIIEQELRMYEDNPNSRLYFNLLEAMYENHTVRINICGTAKSIYEITPDVLYSCYRTFYNLSNMTLAVCGNIDVNKVLEIADRILPAEEPKEIVRDMPNEKREVFKPRTETTMKVSGPLFAIGIKDTDISTSPRERLKKSECCEILNEMLFGKAGEFYNSLYEDGLLLDFDVEYEHNKNFSFNIISGESKNPDEVYERFLKFIEEKQKCGLEKERFEICKRVIYAEALKCFDSTSEIANDMLHSAFEGVDVFEPIEVIKEITFEDVTELLSEMYKKEYFSLGLVLPEK